MVAYCSSIWYNIEIIEFGRFEFLYSGTNKVKRYAFCGFFSYF